LQEAATAASPCSVRLPDGETVPALGQGTWNMGDDCACRDAEIAALRRGAELGMTLIDTAEMYGDGASERLVGEAFTGQRDQLFIVSKVLPQNAGGRRLQLSCEASLKRLGTDRIDLYLLHWPGSVPLADTVAGMEKLREAGKIRHWGVSNFDVDDMEDLLHAGGSRCAVNQVLYNLRRRGPEFSLMPYQEKRSMPLMAYSPVEQGRMPVTGRLAAVAARHGASVMQVALAWVLRDPAVIAIPKAGNAAHVEDNRKALDLALSEQDLAELAAQFPPPARKTSLEML
jgi:diketogulonate reductase-like aldo/keto reductase